MTENYPKLSINSKHYNKLSSNSPDEIELTTIDLSDT